MSGSGITPTTLGGAQPSATKGQVVQIVSLPDGLKDNARALRIQGEVIAQNKDGSVRVRTDQGDIDIQMRGRQPQPGAQVEIDIPAGHPPRQATIRAALPVPHPLPAQPLPSPPLPQTPVVQPSGNVSSPVDGAPDVIPSPQTPVGTDQPNAPDIIVTPTSAVPAKPALPPFSPGQIVQLVPAPAETFAPPSLGTSVTSERIPTISVPAEGAETAGVRQKPQPGLVSTLLQAVKSVLPQTAIQHAPPAQTASHTFTASTAALIPEMPPVTASAMSQLNLILSAKITALTSPAGQTMFAPQVQIQLSPGYMAQMQPSPVPAAQPATTQTPMPAAELLTVPVVSLTEQNKPIIPIPVGNGGATQNFVLQSPPGTLPVGTQITLLPQSSSPIVIPTSFQVQNGTLQTATPTQTPAPASLLPPAWRSLLPVMQPATLWPALDDLFQSFYQATPQAAQVLGRIIPSPANAQSFGPAVLLFVAALKSGDLQAWIGDKKLDMIHKLGKDGVLSRLSGETASLAQSGDTAPTEWKSFPVPMLWQNEISKVLFHVRREPDETDQEANDAGTHFVMDISLTRMGDVQLDGLVRGKRLDLVVRTQLPISLSMQDAMRTAYATALDGTDVYGDIGFQSDIKNFVKIIGTDNTVQASA